jgi:outer membrane receptor protein involved in Fe transport
VYEVGDPGKTVLHGGFSRYYTPPALETVPQNTIALFANTTNAALTPLDDPVKAERAFYYDLGFTHQFIPGLQTGFDGYYKQAKNQIDLGQFGTALIFTPFNYLKGQIFGFEITNTYKNGNLSAYSNFAYSRAMGRDIDSAQFTFTPQELTYIADHYVFLDHDQTVTISAGTSYQCGEYRLSSDFLYGSGLRRGFANTQKLPCYYPLNIAVEREVKFACGPVKSVRFRFDTVNLFNQIYKLRDGTGIGVGAPQYGAHRGFYGQVATTF